jgi:hypothetical protein
MQASEALPLHVVVQLKYPLPSVWLLVQIETGAYESFDTFIEVSDRYFELNPQL